jgi:hypothetical protein
VNSIEQIAQEAANTPLDSSLEFRRDNTFLLYASFFGDAAQTAYATDLSLEEVKALAEQGKWDERLKPILDLKKSRKPGDIERGINRSLNLVQAHRMRLILEAMLRRISAMSAIELQRATTHRVLNKEGEIISETLSTRPLADLTAALEKCHTLTYLALSDTASDRKTRPNEADDDLGASEVHAKLAALFAKGSNAK